ADFIRFLNYASDDRKNRRLVFSCGLWNADRAAAQSLAKFGTRAATEIEQALDSIERRGRSSEFAVSAGWLLIAYARIKGPAAFSRLREMRSNPGLRFLALSLDESAALSLGVTSYVSSFREPLPVTHCDRESDPRDGLDQFILAWERNDPSRLE